MFQVFLSHDEVPEMLVDQHSMDSMQKKGLDGQADLAEVKSTDGRVCMDKFAFYTLVSMTTTVVIVFVILLPYCGIAKLVQFKYKVKCPKVPKISDSYITL